MLFGLQDSLDRNEFALCQSAAAELEHHTFAVVLPTSAEQQAVETGVLVDTRAYAGLSLEAVNDPLAAWGLPIIHISSGEVFQGRRLQGAVLWS